MAQADPATNGPSDLPRTKADAAIAFEDEVGGEEVEGQRSPTRLPQPTGVGPRRLVRPPSEAFVGPQQGQDGQVGLGSGGGRSTPRPADPRQLKLQVKPPRAREDEGSLLPGCRGASRSVGRDPPQPPRHQASGDDGKEEANEDEWGHPRGGGLPGDAGGRGCNANAGDGGGGRWPAAAGEGSQEGNEVRANPPEERQGTGQEPGQGTGHDPHHRSGAHSHEDSSRQPQEHAEADDGNKESQPGPVLPPVGSQGPVEGLQAT